MDHLLNTYARLPVAFTHGRGVWLWDEEGRFIWMLWQALPSMDWVMGTLIWCARLPIRPVS
ncbi:hypothetical protein CARN8_7100006 [mine drainage metagenome]|uniref:Uncharacterized protein n=1 Tax=mine drainage metagenome TaxID=410659 RepID=A0A3P3ZRZ8_9ZZZZ